MTIEEFIVKFDELSAEPCSPEKDTPASWEGLIKVFDEVSKRFQELSTLCKEAKEEGILYEDCMNIP